ncbi:MAG TPA: M12 family metallopeptidase [Chthoniobacterales bacterium]|jgi:hypothetical protein|nr:M12 family metallopeptidase [Chthoniobacterales bacterium]
MKTLVYYCAVAAAFTAFGADPYSGVSATDKEIYLAACLTLPPDQGSGLWTSNVNFKWPRHSTINVSFLDGDDAIQRKVMKFASEWTEFTDIKFVRVSHAGDVRITFNGLGYRSMVGKRAKTRTNPALPTMTLGFPTSVTEVEVRRHVLHEFGHVLGFAHEQQSPSVQIHWKEKEVLRFYKLKAGWDEEKVRDNVLRRPRPTELANSAATAFDPKSIMIYPIPAGLTEDGFSVDWNTTLSERDKKFARQQYLDDGN